ncbi:MAG: colicin import membrane protein [Gammaproteobacteria bacterium]|jgi:colicin import membrane protein
MKPGWLTTLSSSALSLILHVVLGALLIFSFDFTAQPKIQPKNNINTVKAVTVDKKQVELELARIKKVENEKLQKEKKTLDDLEKKTDQLKKDRQAEEKKLAETKKKKEQEQEKRKEEERKLATLEKEKTELKKQRELEEKKIKEAEDKSEKLKNEEEARIKKKIEDKEAAEKKQLEEELASQLAAEESAEQTQKDQALINNIASNIKRSIESNFNKVGLPQGIACVLRVRLIPGGEVVDVTIAESSGNEIFDRRAVNATQKASPLPVPDDVATFERLGLREINMTFKPTN